DLGRSLKLRPAQRAAIREELTDHYHALVDELMGEGLSREAATEKALQEFGDAVELAQRFGRIGRGRIWIMRSMIAASLIAATSIVTSFMVPDTSRYAGAPPRASAGGSAEDSKSAVPVDVEERTAADRRIEDQLDKVAPDLHFDAVTASDVFKYIGELAGIN